MWGDTLTKISILQPRVYNFFFTISQIQREREREKNHGLCQQILSPLTSLRRYYADLNSEEQLKELKIACSIQFSSSTPFTPSRLPILPFIFKIIFCLGRNDLERSSSLALGSRTEDGRRAGIPLARHRVDPLVKTARCPARFTISIDYKTYLGFLFHWYV